MILAMLPPLLSVPLQHVLWPVIQPFAWFLFYPAVFLSSWIGGALAGVVATVISTLLVWWSFVPPEHTLVKEEPRYVLSGAVYVAMGILFSLFHGRLKRATQRAGEALTAARWAGEKLQAVHQQITRLVEQASDGIFIADIDGRYIDVNSAGCLMLGYAREEIVGTSISDLISPADVERLWQAKEQLLRGGIQIAEWTLRRKDGTYLPVEVSAKILPDGRWQAFVRDITERKRAENEIRMLARLQAAVANLGLRALRTDSPGHVLDEAVALVAQTLDVEYCKVLELLPEGHALLLRSGVGWKEGLVGRATVGAGADSQAGYTLLCDQPVVVEDLRTEKRFSGPPLLHEHGVVSGMSVIIATGTGPYGVLGAHTGRRRIFSRDEVHFLQSAANVLGLMIGRCRTEGALRESEANLNRAQEVAHIGSWCLNVVHNRLTWSNEVFHLFGMPPDTPLTYEAFLAAVHPDDREYVNKAWSKALHGSPYDIEHRILIGGGLRWVRERAQIEFDAGGNAIQAIGTVQDVTQRKLAQARLLQINRANRALSKCNQALIRASDESTLLQQICDIIVQEAGYRLCWVGRAEQDDAKSVRAIAQAGWEAGYVAALNVTWADSERGRGPTGTCIRTRKTTIVRHIATDPQMAPWRAEALKRGYASSLAIPLLINSEVYGALTIYAAEPDAFDAEEVELLTELASDLAFGIATLRTRAEGARAEADLREKEEHIRLLLDSTAEAICGLDLRGNCTWANRACAQMLGYADSRSLLGKNFHNTAHYRRPDGSAMPQDECQAWRALARGDYAHSDSEVMWRADGTPFPVEYWSHPIQRNNEIIGAVTTFLDITARKQVEEEIRTLNAELEQRVLARTAELQAANRLKDELILREQAAAAELEQAREHEFEIGYKIQQTLLLDQPPADVPGLRIAALTVPSQRIDGDFYIFIKHQEGHLDVIVGDVMGKGIPAALLGAATKSHFLKALSHLMALSTTGKLPEPREIVMLAHAEMARQLIDLESFVTLCYARLDVKKRRLDLVDCGHTGIVQLHGRTGVSEVLHGDNLPLGVREGEIYEQVSVACEPGDLLVFFSDGITESRNSAGELYGAERLEEYVRAHSQLEPPALVEAIRQAAVAFSESGRLNDDLTSVAIRVEEVELPLARAEIQVQSDLRQLRRVREFVRSFCGNPPAALLDEDSVGALELAVNEAASNIMKHAYHGRSDQWIDLEGEAFSSRVLIRLHHLGEPFDPATAPLPALDGSRESGFGVYIITRSVDEVHYYRDERGRNCVALVKLFKSRVRNESEARWK